MFERLSITFQCHRHRVIELDKVTVFVGDNETGKSAILRALKWLCLNQWEGKADEFIPWGESVAEVGMLFDKDQLVIRQKGKGINQYQLNGDEPLKVIVANRVPDEIGKLLNVCLENFQDQNDPAFWLMLNAGQAAQALNEIFNLSEIDNSNTSIGRDLRETRSQAKTLSAILEDNRQLAESYEWVVKADKDLRELEVIDKEVNALTEQINHMTWVIQELEGCEQDQKNATLLLEQAEAASAIGDEILELNYRIEQYEYLIAMEVQQCRLQEQLQAKENQLREWLQGTCPLCQRQSPPSSLGLPRVTSTGTKKPR